MFCAVLEYGKLETKRGVRRESQLGGLFAAERIPLRISIATMLYIASPTLSVSTPCNRLRMLLPTVSLPVELKALLTTEICRLAKRMTLWTRLQQHNIPLRGISKLVRVCDVCILLPWCMSSYPVLSPFIAAWTRAV